MQSIDLGIRTRNFSCSNARDTLRLDVIASDDCVSVYRGNVKFGELSHVDEPNCTFRLALFENPEPDECVRVLSAAIETLLARMPDVPCIRILLDRPTHPLLELLVASALATLEDGILVVRPELFWQSPLPWLAAPTTCAFPLYHVMTAGRRHPLRSAKPEGTLYARYIPWLDQVLSFRTFDGAADLNLFNRWMNHPRVAPIWDEAGDLDKHRLYVETNRVDPHMLALIGCFNGVPFGYFEVYWAKENRLGPYYDADDYDRGWHVAIGEESFRGKAFVSAWLPSLMHFLFLVDPRTFRIVGEPAATHIQQIRNLERSGFAKIKHVDFSHKRAVLVMLMRERFFGDRLWLPARSEASESMLEPGRPTSTHTDLRLSA